MSIIINDKFDFAYRNLADAYIRVRKFNDAIEALEKVLEITKPEDVVYEAIGYCYEKLKYYSQARFYYRKAYHINPEYNQYVFKIAQTYFKEKMWSKCLQQMEMLITKVKFQPKYYLLMGECYIALENYKEAVLLFSSLIRLQPKSIAGWEGLIKSLYFTENYKEALEQIGTVKILIPDKIIFIYFEAIVLLAMGMKKEGYLVFAKAISTNSKYLKKIIEIEPNILHYAKISTLIANTKKQSKNNIK